MNPQNFIGEVGTRKSLSCLTRFLRAISVKLDEHFEIDVEERRDSERERVLRLRLPPSLANFLTR